MTPKERLKKPLEIYVLLLSFLFTEQFDRNLELDKIDESGVRNILEHSHSFLDALTNHEHALGASFMTLAIALIIWTMMGKNARWQTDLFAGFLTICWSVELLTMNLLLVAPIKSPVLLLTELLLFIPIILVCFSWWYWRLNLRSALLNRQPAIDVEGRLGVLEYLFTAANVFLDYSGDRCHGGAAKVLYLINGFVVLDILGLALSRAVDLAVG